jgi:hypothetical protein
MAILLLFFKKKLILKPFFFRKLYLHKYNSAIQYDLFYINYPNGF